MIGEAFFKWYNFIADFDIDEFEEIELMVLGGLSVGVMLTFLARDDNVSGVELAFRILLIESLGDFFLGFGFSRERNLRQEDVCKSGH
jgi:hypothetical protein